MFPCCDAGRVINGRRLVPRAGTAMFRRSAQVIYPSEQGLDAIMFPVKEVKVFAETRSGRPKRVRAYKAIINGNSGQVISVVSKSYQVLLNSVALDLALEGCSAAFPDTEKRAWRVTQVEAPLTGGHCAVDISYRRPGKLLVYQWEFGSTVTERFEPFLRVRNGYNGRTAFSLHFGLMRRICSNGWIDARALRIAKVSHDTKNIEEVIKREIEQADFSGIVQWFRRMLNDMWDMHVPREHFAPIIRSVLRIQQPKKMAQHLRSDWAAINQAILKKTDTYADELGSTAYALWNAISDLATSPPVGYPLIRRSRHSLQRMASRWLSEFWERTQVSPFDLEAYVKGLSGSSREPQNGRPTASE